MKRNKHLLIKLNKFKTDYLIIKTNTFIFLFLVVDEHI